MGIKMKRGEVWWVAFGPVVEGEIRKERPALIISNDAFNRHLNRVQVVPFTSNVERVYPSEAVVTLSGRPAKAMADQVTTVARPASSTSPVAYPVGSGASGAGCQAAARPALTSAEERSELRKAESTKKAPKAPPVQE